MELKDTTSMMTSKDEHERFKAEYLQTEIRLREVKERMKTLSKVSGGMTRDSSADRLNLRMRALAEYRRQLKMIAKTEGIDLKSLTI